MGFYKWQPDALGWKQESNNPLNSVTADHLKKGSTVNVVPPKILNVQNELPYKLESITSAGCYINNFPYDETYLVGYKLAMDKLSKKGIKVDIHFVFGGSVLKAIKEGNDGKKYFAAMIPGTSTILVTKENGYKVNPSLKGCQFERLMTGKRATDTATYSHMQVLQLNGKNVLFIADTDGVDSQKKAVEIKLSSSRKCDSSFVKSAILQMISNGSNTLVYGSTNKDDTMVTSVKKKYLSNLIKEHTTNVEQTLFTIKIKKTLSELE